MKKQLVYRSSHASRCIATGIYPSLSEAAAKMVQIKKRIEPQKDNAIIYQKDYDRYLDLYNSLLDMFEKE